MRERRSTDKCIKETKEIRNGYEESNGEIGRMGEGNENKIGNKRDGKGLSEKGG